MDVRSQDSAPRKFYHNTFKYEPQKEETDCPKPALLQYIAENIIGHNKVFGVPFGKRKVVYADHIASGKSLAFIENFLREQVLPDYANTHTTTTITALQTTLYRDEARDIVRNAVNASEYDAVIFTGSGSTGAVHKLIHMLSLEQKPIVIVGPFAHHSNLLPWRQEGAMVVRLCCSEDGGVCLLYLRKLLKELSTQSRLVIGCFSAASNVTGTLVDVDDVTTLLHEFGALAFWDYATAAPYTKIDMNPVRPGAHKDAVFFSPHKFVGGVQTPGILVVKKQLVRNQTPHHCGGGTVFFVRGENHRFVKDAETREEGGTPPIVESVRAGLVLQLKEAVGVPTIAAREQELTSLALKRLLKCPNLVLLGNHNSPRLPVFSFLVCHPSGRFLHHNFVSALLNDLFGIQSRGGCACAGPYAQELLGIDEKLAAEYESLLAEDDRLDRTHLRRKQEFSDNEVLRPGFSRLSLAYYMPNDEVDFILSALEIVAEKAWKLLPQYKFDPQSGEWKQVSHPAFKDRMWLSYVTYSTGSMEWQSPSLVDKGPTPENYTECLRMANELLDAIFVTSPELPDQTLLFSKTAERLRWFMLPSEAEEILRIGKISSQHLPPFTPLSYPLANHKPGHSVYFNDDSVGDATSVQKDIKSLRKKDNSEIKTLAEKLSELTVENAPVKSNDESAEALLVNGAFPEDLGKAKDEVVCLDNVCFAPRKTTADAEEGICNSKWFHPPRQIFKPTLQALEEFNMIRPGDKVLVCLSGGKDSLSLLHTLHQYQFYVKAEGWTFDLAAVTVDPGTAAYDPRPLKPYLATLGIQYFYEEQAIMSAAQSLPNLASICSYCSRMKRGRIYHSARREGFNVLAFGQHLDDLAESFIMSIFHNGAMRTMKACYTVQEGDLRVIRPFVYVREKALRDFAIEKQLPVIPENCPACFDAPKERHRTKQLLASQEVLHPRLYASLREAMRPVMGISKTGIDAKSIFSNADDSLLASSMTSIEK